mmetsp:Transcript_1533/g.3687  ORF Transcript_1533/g.3687 Transcript_1533/m.3687 type:complete len:249 (-) Transcript_1533:596-1342(-)
MLRLPNDADNTNGFRPGREAEVAVVEADAEPWKERADMGNVEAPPADASPRGVAAEDPHVEARRPPLLGGGGTRGGGSRSGVAPPPRSTAATQALRPPQRLTSAQQLSNSCSETLPGSFEARPLNRFIIASRFGSSMQRPPARNSNKASTSTGTALPYFGVQLASQNCLSSVFRQPCTGISGAGASSRRGAEPAELPSARSAGVSAMGKASALAPVAAAPPPLVPSCGRAVPGPEHGGWAARAWHISA